MNRSDPLGLGSFPGGLQEKEKTALITTAQKAPASVSVLGGSLGAAADNGWSYSLVTETSVIRGSVGPRRAGGPHSTDIAKNAFRRRYVGSEVPTTATTLCDVTRCSSVEVHRNFRAA
jgi:hypothetical protein